MNENEGRKRREWVKNAAIVFLVIMLILTFFSNTIMNYSLPEVATQYVQSGSITAKVRGTGNVEANDPYNVVVTESRVIESVAVKQGDVVEKDQVLYYLEDKESDELNTARKELADLELTYMKGLFGGTVSPEIINKVASGNTDTFASYQAKVTDMQNRITAAEARVKECQDRVNQVNLQSTVNTNNASVSTLPEESEKAQAAANLSSAQTAQTSAEAAFNREKADKKAAISSQITEKKKQIEDLQALISNAENLVGSMDATGGAGGNGAGGSGTGGSGTSSGTQGGIDQLQKKRNEAYDQMQADYKAFNDALPTTSYSPEQANALTEEDIKNNNFSDDKKKLLTTFKTSYAQYVIANDMLNEAMGALTGYGNNQEQLKRCQDELASLEASLASVDAVTFNPGDSVKQAQDRLNQADKNLTDKTNANKQNAAAYQNQIANADAALKNAQAVLELLKAEQTRLSADINAELDLSKANNDIALKKEEIAKLEEQSIGAAIKSPVAGTVTSLAYAAGETTKPEEPAAVIQVEGKGYTLSISVTNEQAKKVQVGDNAELQNAWYYDDVQMILSAIRPDPDNPGQKKLLMFDVTGSSIQAGQALNISVGQRSQEYELVVPNSAVREDNNGKFILIVESKSSPLGNRYIATRVDVEVLASDDSNTAISAPLYGYEYVITTSTKPVEAGKQVRLNE